MKLGTQELPAKIQEIAIGFGMVFDVNMKV